MQSHDTRSAMEFAGLSAYETWMHYCNMGGLTDYFEFDAYLAGLYAFDTEDADLVSQAVNELIDDTLPDEEAGLCRAPYSWIAGGDEDLLDVAGFDVAHESDDAWYVDTAPLSLEVDTLVAPHAADTFGSRFLAGLDACAHPGRPGVPLPPGAPAELLADILDSGVIGRTVSGERK